MISRIFRAAVAITVVGLCVLLLATGIAATVIDGGGTDCSFPAGTGPDVIVGEIPVTVANYAVAVNDDGVLVDAFSIGTTACNIGDQVLEWFPIPALNHPVISQNMYRLHEGRFEQIGQSWLKHGFASLQESACCTCTGNGDWNHLGVGCSDPYHATLNGGQGGLGPKHEVNAATGVFLPDPQDFRNTGNSVYKRLQVKIHDLDQKTFARAQYFVEAQYVHRDDASLGNDDNSVSWRHVQISESAGPEFSLSISPEHPTRREQAAIFAWKNLDPTVNIHTIDVPFGGRYHIGWKATELGGGQWGYEFAVHNNNSHRSAGAVEIGFQVPTTITNTGFHDVDYHSGEPVLRLINRAPNDWLPTTVLDAVSWTYPAPSGGFADADKQANALRWATMYNFRFEADQPPHQLGQLVISLFREGVPATVSVDLEPKPLENDACADALAISEGTVGFTTIGATTDGPDDVGCTPTVKDVWFRFTAEGSGMYTVDTCGATFDTVLSVYARCPAGPNDELIACDDGCTDGAGPGSTVTFPSIGGAHYWIRVGGAARPLKGLADEGTGPLVLSFELTNDSCETPAATGEALILFDTTDATTDGPGFPSGQCGTGATQAYNDLWFAYAPACDGLLTVSTCDDVHGGGVPSFDTVLVVYGPYDTADDIDCDDLDVLACNDDDPAHACGGVPSYSSHLEVVATPGKTYLVRVGGYSDNSPGAGALLIDCTCRGSVGDIDCDGLVGIVDFLMLLAVWGPCDAPCPPSCPADFDGDCEVGIGDFLTLLGNWG